MPALVEAEDTERGQARAALINQGGGYVADVTRSDPLDDDRVSGEPVDEEPSDFEDDPAANADDTSPGGDRLTSAEVAEIKDQMARVHAIDPEARGN